MLLIPLAFEDATLLDRGDRIRVMARQAPHRHRVRRMFSRKPEAA